MKKGNYKVFPGLSLRGRDIAKRLQNGSLKAQLQKGYLDDIDLSDFTKSDKVQRMNMVRENLSKIDSLKNELNGQA